MTNFTIEPGLPEQEDLRLFDRFTLNLTRRILLQDDRPVSIEPKPLQMLELMVAEPGRVVSVAEFKAKLWSDVSVEISENVNTQINKLRKALGESHASARYILTQPRKGYYFNPKVLISRGKGPGEGQPAVPAAVFVSERVSSPPVVSAEKTVVRIPPVRLLHVGLAALGLVVATACLSWAISPHGPMADFEVRGRNLIAVNGKGRELWIHLFDTDLVREDYQGESKTRRNWLGDLDGSGQQRLLFTWAPSNNAAVGSKLICFGPDNSIKWQFTPGRPVTDASGDHMVPPYHVAHILVMKGRTPAETRVIVSSAHYLKQPDQVAILDANGRICGEYWHPGHLLHLEQADLDGDGRNELLLAGVSNAEHRAVLVVLNPWNISGQVTPVQMQDQRFQLVGMAEAHEKAFVLFPRSCISKGKPYTRATNLYVTADRVVVPVAEGTADVNPGFVYELDYGLRALKVVSTGDEVRIAHQELEARGELDHPYSQEELERLKAGVIVRSGRTEK